MNDPIPTRLSRRSALQLAAATGLLAAPAVLRVARAQTAAPQALPTIRWQPPAEVHCDARDG